MFKNKISTACLLILFFNVFGSALLFFKPINEIVLQLTPINLLGILVLFLWANADYSFKLFKTISLIYIIGILVEVLGVNLNIIFGDYYYGNSLGPKIYGTPLIIGVNWLTLSCTLFSPFEGEDSFKSLDNPQKVEEFFNRVFPDFTPLIPDLIDQFFKNPTSPMGIFKCFPWHLNAHCVLIGDAAHATVPFYGQGMNASFEDCRILDELIDEFDDNINEVLPIYSQRRKPNGDGLQDLSLHNFIVMRDKTADPKFLLQKKIEQKFSKLYPDKWVPLYSMVSFTNISYSDAWEIGMKQERLMKKIMSIANIQEIWDSDEIISKMLKMT